MKLDKIDWNISLCRLCLCQPQTAFRSSKCLDIWTSWRTSSCDIAAVRNSWPPIDPITLTSVKNSPSASAPVCCTELYVSWHNVCLKGTECHLCQVLKYIANGIICSSVTTKICFYSKEKNLKLNLCSFVKMLGWMVRLHSESACWLVIFFSQPVSVTPLVRWTRSVSPQGDSVCVNLTWWAGSVTVVPQGPTTSAQPVVQVRKREKKHLNVNPNGKEI